MDTMALVKKAQINYKHTQELFDEFRDNYFKDPISVQITSGTKKYQMPIEKYLLHHTLMIQLNNSFIVRVGMS